MTLTGLTRPAPAERTAEPVRVRGVGRIRGMLSGPRPATLLPAVLGEVTDSLIGTGEKRLLRRWA